MSIFSKINWFGKRESSDSSSSALVDAIRTAADISQSASSKVSVDQNTSLMCPAYLRALNVIAQHVAILPFRYMWQKDGIYVEKEGDPQHYLLSVQMMSGMSNYQFYFQLVFRTVHYGETLVVPRKIAGEVVEYVLVRQDCWSHDKVNAVYFVSDVENGIDGTFYEPEVLHFIWNSKDGKEGYPLWKLCKPALDIYATGDKETQRRFETGGNVSGIVSNNIQTSGTGVGQYKTSALESVAEQIEEKFREGSKIVAIGGDAKFAPFSMSSTDMQFTDQQKRVVNEIARATGVPTYMLYVETSGTQYNTPEVAQKAFQTQTLEPMLTMIEREFQRKMVPQSLCHKRIFRFDREAIFALDLKSKAEYYEKMLQIGAFTINDIRKKENLASVEGGDTPTVSANLMTIEALKSKEQAPAEPAPVEEPQPKRERDERGRFIKHTEA